MPRDHVIDPSVIHHHWDADLEPILVVSSGDTVSFDIKVAGDGQVWPGATYADTRFDFDTIYNLSGPVWINGAELGPPHRGCGNIDNRHLTSGSTLWIPVHLPGSMFSCGDPHAARGDGEVCVSALEAPLSGSMRLRHRARAAVQNRQQHRLDLGGLALIGIIWALWWTRRRQLSSISLAT